MKHTVYILGTKWTVEFLSNVSEEDHGTCDKVSRAIKVWDGLDTEQMIETVLHEILHAIWEVTALIDSEGEEPTVTKLARGLSTLYGDERNIEFLNLLYEM